MINGASIQATVASWIRSATGLPVGRVILGGQGKQAPPPDDGSYISFQFLDMPRLGSDWLTTERVTSGPDAGRVRHRVQGPRNLHLEIRAFNFDAGPVTGMDLIEMIIMGQALPSISLLLKRGHVGVGTATTPRWQRADRNGILDPFAIVEVNLHVAAEMTELGYEIKHVEGTLQGAAFRAPPFVEGVAPSIVLDDANDTSTGRSTIVGEVDDVLDDATAVAAGTVT